MLGSEAQALSERDKSLQLELTPLNVAGASIPFPVRPTLETHWSYFPFQKCCFMFQLS